MINKKRKRKEKRKNREKKRKEKKRTERKKEMDSANMNAQKVGLPRPADIGADVLHMNLHNTFYMIKKERNEKRNRKNIHKRK
jgi:hypothetical protein